MTMQLKTAIPDTQEGFEEVLNDLARVDKLMADGEWAGFIREYTKLTLQRDSGLQGQFKDAIRDGLKDFFDRADAPQSVRRLAMSDDAILDGRSGGATLSGIYKSLDLTREQRRQIAATGRGPGAALAGKWDTLGKYLIDIHPRTIERNGIPAVYKDMSDGIGADGGFLVPEEFRAELLRLSLESAVVRPRARVIPMASASVRIPAVRDASHASTVFGGVSASWIAEAGSLSTVTQPSFAQVLLTARKLTGYTVASNELLADSAVSLEAIISSMFGDALAYFEDDAFLTGTGAGQPLGVLNAPALVTVAKETGQAATTINYQNLVKMYSRCLPQCLNRCVFYCHPDTFPQLAQLALNIGTGGSAVWISNIQGGPPGSIFGRPVVITEKAETLGTAGDIVMADLSMYLVGDRQSLQAAVSPHVNFTTDEMTWRFTQRVDGRPWLQTSLTPRNGSNTLSCFINLATRS